MYAIDLEDVQSAAAAIKGHANYTPVMTSTHFDGLAGRELFFKCENFQKIGAFKFRGAFNAIKKLDPAIETVITHSSGNHAQVRLIRGVAAHAGAARGVACSVTVLPRGRCAVARPGPARRGRCLAAPPVLAQAAQTCARGT